MNKMKIEKKCRVPPISRPRIYFRIFLNYSITVLVLLLLLTYIHQLGNLRNLYNAFWFIIVLVGLQMAVWPFLIRSFLTLFHKISVTFLLIVFPLLSLLTPAGLLMIADWLSPGLEINGFSSAFLVALFMAILSLVTSVIFADDDESAIFSWVLNKSNLTPIAEEDIGKAGLIFIEIDGLSGKALNEAMIAGKAPNMKRWVDCGSHKLVIWESDLSSQSSAAQAGILHGNNFGIPAFRWYDKINKQVIVSSSITDISNIEKQLSDGRGLLSQGGAARGCLFSGDASRVSMTASRVFDITSSDLIAYYYNPTNLLKSCSMMVWDWYLEKKAAWNQKLRNEQPRINRSGVYFILRSIMTVILRDICFFTVKGDIYSGVPYIYATFVGYDEVSHHSGINRPDTLEVLRKLDREFAKLEKIARDAPRQYYIVVLSDHGQTQGATFRDRYGERLGDLIGRLIRASRGEYHVAGNETQHESAYYIDAAFRDYKLSNTEVGKRFRRTLVNNQQAKIGDDRQNDVIVLSSGNLGLVYFSTVEHRVTLEELMQDFPKLISELVAHPGIGFIMVHSEATGTVIIGKQGKIYLSTGRIEGENPLTNYGLFILPNLIRTDRFPNTPDIMIMSTYWKDTDEVAAFEQLVSSHGGSGGEQSRPFILYPSQFDLGTPKIVGAEAVYQVFKRWTEEVKRT